VEGASRGALPRLRGRLERRNVVVMPGPRLLSKVYAPVRLFTHKSATSSGACPIISLAHHRPRKRGNAPRFSAVPALTAFVKRVKKVRSSGGKRAAGCLPQLLATHSAKEDPARGRA
jgi:hypothetical protein